MVIARITDSYTWGRILYTVHEDCVCEGTSNRIVYYYDSSSVMEPDACRKVVYNLDGNRVTRWVDNNVAYYIDGEHITDTDRKIVGYIKFERETDYDFDWSSNSDTIPSEISVGEGSMGGSGTTISGKDLCIIAAILIGIYSIIIGLISNWLNVGFFQAFFGAPILIILLVVMGWIIGLFCE